MAHKFRLFEMDADGNKYFTGHTIEVDKLPSDYDATDAVHKIFEIYNFKSQWDYMYKPAMKGRDITITYHFLDGYRVVWLLERGE